MRIGLFTDTYLPHINGISYVVQTMQRELTALGHEVHVFAPVTILKPWKKSDEINVHRFPAIEGMFFSGQSTSMLFPPTALRKVKKLNLDIIHVFTPATIGLLGVRSAIVNDTPLINQYSTDLYSYVERYPHVLPASLILTLGSQFMLRLKPREVAYAAKVLKPKLSVTAYHKQLVVGAHTLLHKRCDAVIALSPKMEQLLKKWNPQTYVALLPSGVDAITPKNKQAVAEFRNKHGLKPQDKILLYVGRLGKEKNLELIIDSFPHIVEKHPKAKLVLVGGFDYKEPLMERAKTLPHSGRIVFVDAIPREELGAVYAAADIFLFASLTDTQGLVVNEAAAAGLPLILCDPDVSQVFKDKKTGLLAGQKPRSFAHAVNKLLDDNTLRRRLGRNAKRLAAQYTQKKQIKKLENIYRRIISNKTG